MADSWKLYILRCGDGSLYTGITTDIQRRLKRHRAGKGAKYTRGRGPLTLVYQEDCGDHSRALRRELEIKALTREEKEQLLEKPPPGEINTKNNTTEERESFMNALQKRQLEFINLRLGTFIHFNSATAQFCANPDIIDWEFDHENGTLPRQYPFAPKTWNPDRLDCKQWAAIAKSAGCRFAALTAKHHEGFALWPTAWGEHSVKNAANTTDVVAEYLTAFREAGIQAGLYFSILDLTAGIGKRGCTAKQKEYILGQITELLTNYGEIPFLIVDGWNSPWGGPSYEMVSFQEVDRLVKSLQPNCLLMNIGCAGNLQNTDVVFFENSAGQDAEGGFAGPGIACNKLTKTWFWRQEDGETPTADVSWVQEKLSEYFPLNSAFILNLSPNAHGQVDDNLASAFRQIGEKISLPEPLTELPEGWMERK